MKKVIVIGCPGSGKSTFSKQLHNITGLPLVHLDMLYWNSDRTVVEKNIFNERLEDAISSDLWIIDGNYNSTLELRLKACDTVIFLDYPMEVCLDGVMSRRGKERDDIPWIENETDEEFVEFIKNYNSVSKPEILTLFDKYTDKDVIIFKSREEADIFLNSIMLILENVDSDEYLNNFIKMISEKGDNMSECESVYINNHEDYIDILNTIRKDTAKIIIVHADYWEKNNPIIERAKELMPLEKVDIVKEWHGTVTEGTAVEQYTFTKKRIFFEYLADFEAFFINKIDKSGIVSVEETDFKGVDIAFEDADGNVLFYTTTHEGYAHLNKKYSDCSDRRKI